MKPTCRYIAAVLLSASTFMVKAKEGSAPYNSAVQFMQNKGQITDQHGVVRKDIDVKIEANGVVLFVGDGELHYQWVAAQRQNSKVKSQKNPISKIENQQSEIQIYRMDVKLIGANKNAQVIFEEPTGYYENYYLAHTGEEGVSARGYGRVVYKDIYPNIDLVFYTARVSAASAPPPSAKLTPPPAGDRIGKVSTLGGDLEGAYSRSIKYDFIVHPGGNPADIKLRYEGVTELKLVDGSLVATTPYGCITEAAPYSYSKETGEEISSAYRLSGNTLSFDVGNYTGTLVIDPTLHWATYYGGSGADYFGDIQTDVNGNVYVVGQTTANGNIATTGAHQASLSGPHDAFIVKLNRNGARQWATYYGGSSGDNFEALAIDAIGNVYCAGSTMSTNAISTTGAHQTSLAPFIVPKPDGMLVKFSSNGIRQWGTYYGGSGNDFIRSCVIDNQGNIYIGGGTQSQSAVATNGSDKTSLGGNHDCFLVKFSSAGNRLWGTYVGGASNDDGGFVTCDASGNVYLTGISTSQSGFATTGSYQAQHAGNWDVILAKYNASGVKQWATYYGGWNADVALDIACYDSSIYLTGITYTDTGLATPGAYQYMKNNSAGYTGFVSRFSHNGSLQWGTYYGGSDTTYLQNICISNTGNIYLGGVTKSTSGIASSNAYQGNSAGGFDVFYVEMTTSGIPHYATYYGGPLSDGWAGVGGRVGIAVNDERVLLGSETYSWTGISTPGAHQARHGDSNTVSNWATDCFIACFSIDTSVYILPPFTDTVVCAGDTLDIIYEVTRKFRPNNTFYIQLSDTSGNFASYTNIGTAATNSADTIACAFPLTLATGKGYKVRIVGTAPADTDYVSTPIHIKAIPQNFTASHNGPLCVGDTLQLNASITSTGVAYSWTGPDTFTRSLAAPIIPTVAMANAGNYIVTAVLSGGCPLTKALSVAIDSIPLLLNITHNTPVCDQDTVVFSVTSSLQGVTYSWTGPGNFSSNSSSITIPGADTSDSGYYYIKLSRNWCSSAEDSVQIIVHPPIPALQPAATNSPLCQRQDLQLTASNITGASYTWYGPTAFTANIQNPVRANMQMGDAGTYYVYATISGCVSDTDSVVVVVNTDPFVNIFPTPGASICQGKQVIFTAVPTNGGTTSYNWLVNGIGTGGTGTTYSTTTLNNGDAVSCAMTSTGTCATPFIDTSNAITMTVQPILTPTVTITADNMPPWNGGLTVTFTANPTHGGSNPTYQWKRNGQDITGATGATWGVIVNALNANEDICVVLKSSYECAVPDTAMSNCITTAFTGIVGEATNNGFKIYPNPVSGILHIEGVEAGSTIELIDVLGRKCAITSPYPTPARGGINSGETHFVDVSSLVPGVYVVRVDGIVAGRVVKE